MGVAYLYWGVGRGPGSGFSLIFLLFLCFSFVFCHDSGLFI